MNKPPVDQPIKVKGSKDSLIDCLWNGELGECRSCRASIGFALTNKNKKWIPFNAYGQNTGIVEPHWSTCPNAKDFRKK